MFLQHPSQHGIMQEMWMGIGECELKVTWMKQESVALMPEPGETLAMLAIHFTRRDVSSRNNCPSRGRIIRKRKKPRATDLWSRSGCSKTTWIAQCSASNFSLFSPANTHPPPGSYPPYSHPPITTPAALVTRWIASLKLYARHCARPELLSFRG